MQEGRKYIFVILQQAISSSDFLYISLIFDNLAYFFPKTLRWDLNYSLDCVALSRASNSPALRGSLPPGHYFSRSPGKHVKSPTWMKKIPPSM